MNNSKRANHLFREDPWPWGQQIIAENQNHRYINFYRQMVNSKNTSKIKIQFSTSQYQNTIHQADKVEKPCDKFEIMSSVFSLYFHACLSQTAICLSVFRSF
jgi:hypothetical protein